MVLQESSGVRVPPSTAFHGGSDVVFDEEPDDLYEPEVLYGMRAEVPFECFAYHYWEKRDPSLCESLTRRFWALLDLCEGYLRVTVELVAFAVHFVGNWVMEQIGVTCFSYLFNLDDRQDVLKAQWQGVWLSAYAIFSPTGAIEEAKEVGIGAPHENWRWGTLYEGSRPSWWREWVSDQYIWYPKESSGPKSSRDIGNDSVEPPPSWFEQLEATKLDLEPGHL